MSKKLTRAAHKRLDTYGEAAVFELYMKYRSVRNMLKNMPESVGKMSNRVFYEWLKADKTGGRWDRWQGVKEMIASDLVEEGLMIVDVADDGSIPAARLRVEHRRWMAERLNRVAYGKNETTALAVNGDIGAIFLTGLKEVESRAMEKGTKENEIEEADYEVLSDKTE
tara:strand:+ start:4882 stop:5385 length:504 start_codon:yes stop_codon:yes gene_type:complete